MELSTIFDKDNKISSTINEISENSETFRNLRITTMTILLSLNNSLRPDSAEQFVKWFQDTKSSESWVIKEKAGFYNCVIVNHIKNSETKKKQKTSIKIFMNGRVHITGCKNIQTAVEFYGNIVTDLVNEFNDQVTQYKTEPYKITNYNIQLINTCTKLHLPEARMIDLANMCKYLQDLDYNVFYNVDSYPGLRLKLEYNGHKCTAICFESGSLLINGFVHESELSNVVGILHKYLTQSYNVYKELLAVEKKTKGKKRKFDYSEFIAVE
jgi:TATA-box binding protein (TBP) (component of TFIID and TFIIIB)